MSLKTGQHNLIINLSETLKLTLAQTVVLSKGLSFIPTPRGIKTQKIELQKDLQKYHRRLKLEAFFEGKKRRKEKLPFTHGSEWTPMLSSLPKQIRSIMRADLYALRHLDWRDQPHSNLTLSESKALGELQKNHKIIIKPADKGNAVVIQDRDRYIWEGERQLAVSDHYKTLDKPIYLETMNEVRDILEEMGQKHILKRAQIDYLMGPGTPRARRFYLLPKIHKEPEKWSIPFKIPPGRPIVSDCNSETYYTAEYIEHFLGPISQKHPSYLKDTYDFISKVKNIQIPNQALLFTIDIDSLYTNIETQAGMEAVKKCMEKYTDSKRPDKYVLKLLDINLNKNDFEFDSKLYLQIKGTAMGKKFAPSYANIFMAAWEESALASSPLKPQAYFRFLDDIWGVWTHSRESFLTFIEHLNNHQRSIKVKYTLSDTEVNFLDVVSYKGTSFTETNKLDFRVYFKDTDTHCLLHKASFHPKHTFRGIIKSQLLRFQRICTEQAHFFNATHTLFKALAQRNYSRSFLRGILKSFLKPKITIVPTEQSKNKIIPLVSRFDGQSTQLNKAIKENFTKFLDSTNYLQKHRPMAAYCRNKNLLDKLVQSKLSKPALNTRKGSCRYYVSKRWVKNKTTNQIFEIQQSLSPHTVNCVYLISCTKCTKQYVGQTKNEINTRVYQHTHNIKHKIVKRRHLVQHFLIHGINSLKITGLQSDLRWSLQERLRMERLWIKKLDTTYPRGLNEA